MDNLAKRPIGVFVRSKRSPRTVQVYNTAESYRRKTRYEATTARHKSRRK